MSVPLISSAPSEQSLGQLGNVRTFNEHSQEMLRFQTVLWNLSMMNLSRSAQSLNMPASPTLMPTVGFSGPLRTPYVKHVKEDLKSVHLAHDPHHPHADEDGKVLKSTTNPMHTLIDMKQFGQLFQVFVKIRETTAMIYSKITKAIEG